MAKADRYLVERVWIGSEAGLRKHTRGNKRVAIRDAHSFRNVGLVAMQRVTDTVTGEVLWKSNGWTPEALALRGITA